MDWHATCISHCMDTALSTKICPRCRQERELSLYQDPVSMCLLCYSTQAGNQGLAPHELINKAKSARKGKLQRNAQTKAAFLRGFAKPVLTHEPIVEADICDACLESKTDCEARMIAGEVKVICQSCWMRSRGQ